MFSFCDWLEHSRCLYFLNSLVQNYGRVRVIYLFVNFNKFLVLKNLIHFYPYYNINILYGRIGSGNIIKMYYTVNKKTLF